jgi:hypothetical protein
MLFLSALDRSRTIFTRQLKNSMHTPADLIDELKRNAESHVYFALVIALPPGSTFPMDAGLIFADDEKPLESLRKVIVKGGKPVGFAGIKLPSGRMVQGHSWLIEGVDDPRADAIMRYITENMANDFTKRGASVLHIPQDRFNPN